MPSGVGFMVGFEVLMPSGVGFMVGFEVLMPSGVGFMVGDLIKRVKKSYKKSSI